MPAPATPVTNAPLLFKVLGTYGRTDKSAYLADRFPFVSTSQRPNIGVVPENLYGLIRSAQATGTLGLAVPPRDHAMLFTTASKIDSVAVQGLGIVTDRSGKVHYFRTQPFYPPWQTKGVGSHKPSFDKDRGQLIVPPRANDGDMFGSRPIALHFEDGQVQRLKNRVKLAHVGIQPLGIRPIRRVYPDDILDKILFPNFEEAGGSLKNGALVEWSDKPV